MAKQAPKSKAARKPKAGARSKPASAPKLSQTAGITKAKKRHESTDNIYGRNLPSHRLRFPQTGNISAAEQVVFLTESGLRSHDALNRLIQHGLDAQTLVFKISKAYSAQLAR